jgi:organic radical activating enzyme
MIEVSDLFIAPQGEGPNMGRSSLFARFRRCNLHCSFCDTAYTWDKDAPGYDDFEAYASPKHLLGAMLSKVQRAPQPPEAVVFTGGEPMIYQRDLPWIIQAYASALKHEYDMLPAFEMETAGTITPTQELAWVCHFNVSHKLPSMGNEDIPIERLWNREAMIMFIRANATFKPVVGLPEDERAIRLYLSMLKLCAVGVGVPWKKLRSSIYLMPCAAGAGELLLQQAGIVELALELGVRVTTRLQVIAYDAGRGK